MPVELEPKDSPLSFHRSLQRPWDKTYQAYKDEKVRTLLQFPEHTLKSMLRHQQQQPAPKDETGGQLTREILSDLANPMMPDAAKAILGSASGSGLTDGSPLIRQDLESIVLA